MAKRNFSDIERLPDNHYRVYMDYSPMPSLDALRQEYGPSYDYSAIKVSDIFDGRAWRLHESCKGMDRKPSEKIFYIHSVGRGWKRKEQIAWGLKQRNAVAPNGYRPATHVEVYEFSRFHPELSTHCVGLGSYTLDNGRRCVVGSGRSYNGERFLKGLWLGGRRFSAKDRVLFVSK